MSKAQSSVFDIFSDIKQDSEKTDQSQPVLMLLKSIHPDPNQPRKEFDEEQINNLAESIKSIGLLQPILIRKSDDKNTPYQIIDGERRWRAAKSAGILEISVHIRNELEGNQRIIAQIVANANRTDLSDLELAISIRDALDRDNTLKQNTISKLFNKNKSAISRLLSMLNPSILPLVEEGLLKSAEDCALFKGLSDEHRDKLIEQSRLTGKPIKTVDLRIAKKEIDTIATNIEQDIESPSEKNTENNKTEPKKTILRLSARSFSRLLSKIDRETEEEIEIKLPNLLAGQLISSLGGVPPDKTGKYGETIKQLLSE